MHYFAYFWIKNKFQVDQFLFSQTEPDSHNWKTQELLACRQLPVL